MRGNFVRHSYILKHRQKHRSVKTTKFHQSIKHVNSDKISYIRFKWNLYSVSCYHNTQQIVPIKNLKTIPDAIKESLKVLRLIL